MPFDHGSVSYASFRVTGGPAPGTSEVLDMLAAHPLKGPSVGPPPEIQAGWTAGRHVYDSDFTAEANLFGADLLFAMRVDVTKVPAELRRAYQLMAERKAATANPSGFASRQDKREAREAAEEHCREELASGRHTRTKLVPVWWNLADGLLRAPVFSENLEKPLGDLLTATFGASLERLTSGAMGREVLDARGRTRDYEDLAPTPFTGPPPGADFDEGQSSRPTVSWSQMGLAVKDFLGNEFLLWLWARIEAGECAFGDVEFAIDRALDMQCAWDTTGTQSLRADGPTRLPEARAALGLGKWPRKAGLLLVADGESFSLSLQGDRFLVAGAKLPKPEEKPASPREIVEQRLSSLTTLDRALGTLYRAFLDERTGPRWPSVREELSAWARTGRRPAPRQVVEVKTPVEVVVAAEQVETLEHGRSH